MSDPVANHNQDVPPMRPEDIPDPNGEPVSLISGATLDKLAYAGLAAVAGGAGLFLFGALMTPCVGATRSARLLREQRQQEVAEAIAQFEATQPTTPNENVTP